MGALQEGACERERQSGALNECARNLNRTAATPGPPALDTPQQCRCKHSWPVYEHVGRGPPRDATLSTLPPTNLLRTRSVGPTTTPTPPCVCCACGGGEKTTRLPPPQRHAVTIYNPQTLQIYASKLPCLAHDSPCNHHDHERSGLSRRFAHSGPEPTVKIALPTPPCPSER